MDDGISRRSFLSAAAGGMMGLSLAPGLLAQDPRGTAKRVIVLWMGGGPSQLDTFDPKPGTETGGPFKAMETAAPGMRISERLPRLARVADKFSIVRSLTSREGDHERGTFLFHTGYRDRESFPYPSVGSVVSFEKSDDVDFPRFVTIGTEGFGPAFLGSDHSPFRIDNPGEALNRLNQISRRTSAMDLREAFDRGFVESRADERILARESTFRRLRALRETPFADALDLQREPVKVRKAFGGSRFGQGCLLARRLLEAGVRFVEVHLPGWDTHENNFGAIRGLSRTLDGGFSRLLIDLDSKGLLKETVVLWLGEFGRTPTINGAQGRDHYPDVCNAVLAGGSLQGGLVIGKTDVGGRRIVSKPVGPADLFATLYAALGIDPVKKFFNPEGGIVKATEDGEPIRELLS